MNTQKARTGFTLIELLTVIAIIGILAAILIPVVGKVRESARTAKCISNVRQVTTAIILFGDEVGHFPYASRAFHELDFIYWRDQRQARLVDSPIAPFVGGALERELLICPEDKASAEREYFPSYTMNGYVAGNSSSWDGYAEDGIEGRLERLRDPSRVVIMVDEESPDDGHFAARGTANHVSSRHNGKGTLGFADGHVALMTNKDARDNELFNPVGIPRPAGR